MSNHTPSRRRREGRNAFTPGENALLLNPYKAASKRQDWQDGWNEAEADYLDQTEQENFNYDDPIAAIEYAVEHMEDAFGAIQFLQDWQHGEYDEDFKRFVDTEYQE